MGNNVTGYWLLLNAILDQACVDCQDADLEIREEARDWIIENGYLWAVVLGYSKSDTKTISKLIEEVTVK